MAKTSKKNAFLAASVAGILAMGTFAAFSATANAEDAGTVPCYGINACKGMGDCGSKAGNSCAGKNACKGTGFVKVAKDSCTKIQGGKLTA